jgi:hypothetical protein
VIVVVSLQGFVEPVSRHVELCSLQRRMANQTFEEEGRLRTSAIVEFPTGLPRYGRDTPAWPGDISQIAAQITAYRADHMPVAVTAVLTQEGSTYRRRNRPGPGDPRNMCTVTAKASNTK